jgi:uncharacterized phage protein (TIGR02220 family)
LQEAEPLSDQGTWFKLWISALHDPDLSNLSLEDFARWAILGTYIKAHGTEGKLTVRAPARSLCDLFRVTDLASLRDAFHRLPNVVEEMQKCNGEGETILSVSLRNWARYQGDYSTYRVRKFREMKRSKRRGEEKRGEETRKEVTTLSGAGATTPNGHNPNRVKARSILTWLNTKAGRNFPANETNLRMIEARLKDGAADWQMKAVISKRVDAWKGDPKMAPYLRPKTLFNATNFSSYVGELPKPRDE